MIIYLVGCILNFIIVFAIVKHLNGEIIVKDLFVIVFTSLFSYVSLIGFIVLLLEYEIDASKFFDKKFF
jgi:hypothetical protein